LAAFDESFVKHCVLILRNAPLNHIKNLEAFRIGLGLTLSSNEVTVAMVDEGVFNAVEMRPELVERPSVEAFLGFYDDVGVRQLADREALERYGVEKLRNGVAAVDRGEIVAAIRQADVVIPF
jgi:sulfur relay (sulfurtransferase) DsrF/TusC family protein